MTRPSTFRFDISLRPIHNRVSGGKVEFELATDGIQLCPFLLG